MNQRGAVTQNTYDPAGRVIESTHSDGILDETRNFTYDLAGNMLSVTEWRDFGGLELKGRTVYEYDGLYRVVKETRVEPDAGTYTVESRYDPKGNRVFVRQPDGDGGMRTLRYSYDRQGRMVSGGGASYTYDVNGNRTGCVYPSGIVHEYTYDKLNRVKTCDTTNSAQGDVYHCGYTYDLVGNRTHITESVLGADAVTRTRELDYEYDDEYRLLSEIWTGTNCENGSYVYTYDKHANRTSMTKDGVQTTYIYNTRTNELESKATASQTTTYTYDPAGNRISKAEPGKVTRYWYDQFNRLDTVTADEGSGDEIVFQAEYDYRTRRTWKWEKPGEGEGDGWTHFRYDGGVSFDEWKANAQGDWEKTVSFTRGHGMGGGIGSIIYADRRNAQGVFETEYFHYNAVGHTVAQTDGSRSVIASNLYEAFGNIVSSTGTSDNNRLANTKERDFTIALDNHGFRYYDPEVGRYTTRDPAGYGGGLNLYLYVGNNPVNDIDPLGLWKQFAALRLLTATVKPAVQVLFRQDWLFHRMPVQGKLSGKGVAWASPELRGALAERNLLVGKMQMAALLAETTASLREVTESGYQTSLEAAAAETGGEGRRADSSLALYAMKELAREAHESVTGEFRKHAKAFERQDLVLQIRIAEERLKLEQNRVEGAHRAIARGMVGTATIMQKTLGAAAGGLASGVGSLAEQTVTAGAAEATEEVGKATTTRARERGWWGLWNPVHAAEVAREERERERKQSPEE